ncbi:MAG: hypothetical protein QF793_00255 [Candidatus Peribacteraceae bacterium]|jgi:hypothetical protein|nr:hypothetical protein [Candidatus Peribacteraceae bacterium]|tara:strand:- start:4424 stop:6235 length:1812 start_codon:yes stop_codon:yes gene_type:complete
MDGISSAETGSNPEYQRLRELLDSNNFEELKSQMREMMDAGSFEIALQSLPPELAQIGLEVAEQVPDLQKRTDYLVAGMMHPDQATARIAAGMVKRSGNPVSLLTKIAGESDTRKKAALAAAAFVSLPVVPPAIEKDVKNGPMEDLAISAYIDRIPPEQLSVDVGVKFGSFVNKVDSDESAKKATQGHEDAKNKAEEYILYTAVVQSSKDLTKKQAKEKTAKVQKALKKANISTSTLYLNPQKALNALKKSDIDKADLDFASTVVKEVSKNGATSYALINNHQIAIHLLQLEDKRYYNQYVKVLNSSLSQQQRLLEQRRILLQAATARKSSLTDFFSAQAEAIGETRATSAIATGIAEAVAVGVSAVAVIDQVIGSDKDAVDEDESKVSAVESQMPSELKIAIAQSTNREEREDGSMALDIGGYTVVFDVLQGTLKASLESADDTVFPVEDLTVSGIEHTAVFRVTPHDLNKAVLDGDRYTDRETVAKVFHLDTTDERMSSRKDNSRLLYEKHLSGMVNIRETVIDMYKTLGVITQPSNTVDPIKAARAHALFAYLDATMGLQYVSTEDIVAIGKRWQQAEKRGEPVVMMVPEIARSQMEDIA